MEDIMTDKQMEILLTLVADKFAGCKDMEEVEKAIQEVREMAQKISLQNRLKAKTREGGLATAPPSGYIIADKYSYDNRRPTTDRPYYYSASPGYCNAPS